jgi:hypothetical protein
MARSVCSLTPKDADFPDSNAMRLDKVNGRSVLKADATTDQTAYWTLEAWQGITFPVTLVVTYMMASATSGALRLQAGAEAVSDGDATDLDATTSFDTLVSAGETVPGTAGHPSQLTLTFTATGDMDDAVAGDYLRFSLSRDADGTSGTDDATGDAYILLVGVRDSA